MLGFGVATTPDSLQSTMHQSRLIWPIRSRMLRKSLRRLRSTLTGDSTSSSPPRIVSRRAWEQRTKGKETTKKTGAKKEEEKPWPRPYRLAAFAAAGVAVPYCISWFLSLHEPSRRLVVDGITGAAYEEWLRSHFGEEELDSTSYYERLRLGVVTPYKLEDEQPKSVRSQQERIASIVNSRVPVKISRLEGDFSQLSLDQQKTLMEQKSLPGDALVSEIESAGGGTLALDFDDLPETSDSSGPGLMDDGDFSLTEFKVSKPISESTQVYSSWFYLPPSQVFGGGDDAGQAPRMSATEIEISRLEHELADLMRQLTDPMTTRDLDELEGEMKQAKGQLRSLRWKRRLGMS